MEIPEQKQPQELAEVIAAIEQFAQKNFPCLAEPTPQLFEQELVQ